ncbi:40S RIBOSOMAL PROTEIN S29 [Carpediemonas membranifera]|uniref:40S RIBOSOMAL PROTEIN S29 n=1 Tax=Carpediemonas membranifera TaxID=201153 RepID=A0A8J6EAV8_9EUKA|nr:40S RIBOSOMAL PROTEIN S29 [Carpediemonas membranifera]|eukprot:KAG9395500.1 40S RIBOSOMAL PROTEIN S29 [Carpediemonas membranifera]
MPFDEDRTMAQSHYFSHPRNFGKGSRSCRVCGAHQGLIRKYDLMVCRRCFREYATDLGFAKPSSSNSCE